MGHLVLYIGLLARRVFLLPRQFDNGSIEIIKRRERVGDQAKPGIIIITSTGRGCSLLEKQFLKNDIMNRFCNNVVLLPKCMTHLKPNVCLDEKRLVFGTPHRYTVVSYQIESFSSK